MRKGRRGAKKGKGSELITRSVMRNMLRKKFGNKGMKQYWHDWKLREYEKEHPKKGLKYYFENMKRTDPAKRHNKQY